MENAFHYGISERAEHNDMPAASKGLVRRKDEKEYCNQQTSLNDGCRDDPEN